MQWSCGPPCSGTPHCNPVSGTFTHITTCAHICFLHDICRLLRSSEEILGLIGPNYVLQEDCSLIHLSLAGNGLTDSSVATLARCVCACVYVRYIGIKHSQSILHKHTFLHVWVQVSSCLPLPGVSGPIREPGSDLSRARQHPVCPSRWPPTFNPPQPPRYNSAAGFFPHCSHLTQSL